jgi:ADP-ribosylglycohydrolase
MKKITRDQVIASFLGIGIGDAMGAPVETMTREKIRETLGEEGVTTYLPKALHKYEWARGLTRGATTDDWALTAAMAKAIIREPENTSLAAVVLAHIEALHSFDFGKNIKESLERWEAGAETLQPLFSHKEAVKRKNSGNGTIMKLMPVVVLGIAKGDGVGVPLLRMSSRVTHRDARSIVLAFTVYLYATLDDFLYKKLTPRFVSCLTQMSLDELGHMVELSEKSKGLFAADIVHSLSTITPDVESLPSRFTAMETAPFVISVCQRARSFKEGVLLAVNAGGDTDTNASIVGGLLGLRYGTAAIPQEWIDGCLSSQEAILLANQLCDALDIA